jgi:sulfur carrier protein ThiS
MKVNVFVDRIGKTKNLDVTSMKDIFDLLEINSDEYIIVRNDELITEDTELKEKDNLKLLSVISGG